MRMLFDLTAKFLISSGCPAAPDRVKLPALTTETKRSSGGRERNGASGGNAQAHNRAEWPLSQAANVNSLLALSRLIDGVNARIARVANACVLLACVISAGNALIRYGFSVSSNAWLEIQWYLFAAMFMLGAPYTLKTNGHVRVDILYGNVPPRARLWIDLLGCILFLMPAATIICWMSWPIFVDSYVHDEMSNNAGGLVRWPVKLLLPLGFALLGLQGLSEIIKRIATLAGYQAGLSEYEKPLQ
jgi:TRAP-type mannitol/chloroaromatic compound transport system permease small subunit